jgi:hypothetical protein
MKNIMDMSNNEFNLLIKRILLFCLVFAIPIMALTFVIIFKNLMAVS